MQNHTHIYSQERLQSFMNKYTDSINIDINKPILCGIINLDELNIAAQLLKQGELVAFPTETVYGLGANALNSEAILSIFKTKKRPLSDPLIVHIHNPNHIYTEKPDFIDDFAKLFWPGPFTIVLKSTQLETTPILSAGTGSIGIRIPNNEIALELLRLADIPVAAPSANLFTHISPTSAVHVFNDFYDQRIHIIDAGRCNNGIESTIIKPIQDELQILRLGSLARETIELKLAQCEKLKHFKLSYVKKYLQCEENDNIELEQELPALKRKNSSMEAPGQLLKHYSSTLQTYLISTKSQDTQQLQPININPLETVIIDFGSNLQNKLKSYGNFVYKSLSLNCDAQEAMYNLYESLRWAEIQKGIKLILLYDFDSNYSELEIKNQQNIPTIQDKIYRSASGQKILFINNEFKTII